MPQGTALRIEFGGLKELQLLFAVGPTILRQKKQAAVAEALEIYRADLERRVRGDTSSRTGTLHSNVRAKITASRASDIEAEVFYPPKAFYGHILDVGATAHQGIRTTGGATRVRSRGHPGFAGRHWRDAVVASNEGVAERLVDGAARAGGY